MVNFLKNIFSNKKEISSEHTVKMTNIKKYKDGSFKLTVNKNHGLVNGVHYTKYIKEVKLLKGEKKYQEAIKLLLKLVDATENESIIAGKNWGVAPWYYEQLAIIYRKEKMYKEEIVILERYMEQPKAPGVGVQKLSERLQKIIKKY